MTTAPLVWTQAELEEERLHSIELFRETRMEEPLEKYLEQFDVYRDAIEDLLEMTMDLTGIEALADKVLADPRLLTAVRYLSGPPISEDDLKVLAEASLAPTRLAKDAEMAQRVISTVLIGLDRNRFPWVGERREPTEAERHAAALASAAMMAYRKVMTDRANESKSAQEALVKAELASVGLKEVHSRQVVTMDDAPQRGEYCGENLFGTRKADIIVRLYDGRVMPIECKVSNSSTNSVKRLNNDAAAKAAVWLREFGSTQVVPAAVISGVFKRHNLEQAQDAGLSLFWAHRLETLTDFVERARRDP